MSGFAKPPTPTKTRSNAKPTTPTRLKSLANTSGSNSNIGCSSTKVLNEINLLLYLETLKRNMDSEIILKQKLEDSYKQFEERRDRYLTLIAKYARLVKLACTRAALQENELIDLPSETSCIDIENIIDKLSSGSATDYINTTELEKFKKTLNEMDKYKNLPSKRSELVDLQNATDAIQYSIEAIEISLEKSTVQGLDHFAESLDMANYPKLLNEYEQKEY